MYSFKYLIFLLKLMVLFLYGLSVQADDGKLENLRMKYQSGEFFVTESLLADFYNLMNSDFKNNIEDPEKIFPLIYSFLNRYNFPKSKIAFIRFVLVEKPKAYYMSSSDYQPSPLPVNWTPEQVCAVAIIFDKMLESNLFYTEVIQGLNNKNILPGDAWSKFLDISNNRLLTQEKKDIAATRLRNYFDLASNDYISLEETDIEVFEDIKEFIEAYDKNLVAIETERNVSQGHKYLVYPIDEEMGDLSSMPELYESEVEAFQSGFDDGFGSELYIPESSIIEQ